MDKRDAYSFLFKLNRVDESSRIDELIESLSTSDVVPISVEVYASSVVKDIMLFLEVSRNKKLYNNLSSNNLYERCTALSSFITRLSIENENGNDHIPLFIDMLIDTNYVLDSVYKGIMHDEGYENDIKAASELVKYLIDSREELSYEDF